MGQKGARTENRIKNLKAEIQQKKILEPKILQKKNSGTKILMKKISGPKILQEKNFCAKNSFRKNFLRLWRSTAVVINVNTSLLLNKEFFERYFGSWNFFYLRIFLEKFL